MESVTMESVTMEKDVVPFDTCDLPPMVIKLVFAKLGGAIVTQLYFQSLHWDHV
jgi:hypothetical protein